MSDFPIHNLVMKPSSALFTHDWGEVEIMQDKDRSFQVTTCKKCGLIAYKVIGEDKNKIIENVEWGKLTCDEHIMKDVLE